MDYVAPGGVPFEAVPTPPGLIPYPYQVTTCTCRMIFTRHSDLADHLRMRHKVTAEYKCGKCERVSYSYLSTACHYAKCNGAVASAAGDYHCDACSMSFSTQPGLGQHERHMHPELRNARRTEQAVRIGPKAYPSIWSADELSILMTQEVVYAKDPAINKRIAEHLPFKTMKQVSNKRALLREAKDRSQGPASTTEQSSGTLWSVGGPAEDAEIDPPDTPQTEKGWKSEMFGSILCPDEDCQHPMVETLREMGSAAQSGNLDSALIDRVVESFLLKASSRPSNITQRQRHARKPSRRTRAKQANLDCYAKAQRLFEKDPRRLLDEIITGELKETQLRVTPSSVDFNAVYENLWGRVVTDEVLLDQRPVGAIGRWCPPVTGAEVRTVLKKIAPRTAPGPDGMTKKDLLGADPDGRFIAAVSTAMMALQHMPSVLQRCRTVLLPKPKKELSDPKNWRPLTIAPLLSRLYSSLVLRRLRGLTGLDRSQRGFVAVPGCSHNVFILNSIVSLAKKKGAVCIAFLDISKAFDTVPHSLVIKCLRAYGIPEPLLQCAVSTFCGAETVLQTGTDAQAKVILKRGVKQGDPMSPFLFNLVLDPLLRQLQLAGAGYAVADGVQIPALAFADDLNLFAESPEALQR